MSRKPQRCLPSSSRGSNTLEPRISGLISSRGMPGGAGGGMERQSQTEEAGIWCHKQTAEQMEQPHSKSGGAQTHQSQESGVDLVEKPKQMPGGEGGTRRGREGASQRDGEG